MKSSGLTPRVHSTFERWNLGDLDPEIFSAFLVHARHLDMRFSRGASSPEALRGDAIFHSAEAACVTCHVDAVTVDGKSSAAVTPSPSSKAMRRRRE